MTRLGLVIGAGYARAVALRRGRVVWSTERAIGTEPAEELAALLDHAPRARSLGVALGAPHCQLRILRDVPPMSARRLHQAVALEPERWFLRNGHPPVTGAWWQDEGTALALAAEPGMVQLAETLARRGRLRLAGITAHATAAARLLPDGMHALDGECVTVTRGMVTGHRRDGTTTGTPVPPFCGAQGVAMGVRHGLRAPGGVAARESRDRRWARRLLIGGAGLWLLAVGTAWWRLDRALNAAAADLDAVRTVVAPVLAARSAVADLEAALAVLATSAAGRSTDHVLLERLAAALPANVTLAGLSRAADGTVELTLAEGELGNLDALRHVAGVGQVRIDAGTVRFTWRTP